MGRRAHSVIVSQGQVPPAVPAPPEPTPKVEATPPEVVGEEVPKLRLLPVTERLLPYYEKINTADLVTLKEFNKICLISAGDERRAIHRLVQAVYQRALDSKKGEEVKRARFMLTLHERRKLLRELELGSI